MKCVFLIFCVVTAIFCNGQSSLARVDSLLQGQPVEFFNGSIGIQQNGSMVYQRSAGYADFNTRATNENNSLFNIASIAKSFTSTAVLQLMEAGKIGLENPVQYYLPHFPFPEISIFHLLSHTSGLPDLELYEDIVRQYPDSIISNTTTLPALRRWQKGLKFKPGDQWKYCNTNYVVLALLIEQVTGKNYGAYLAKHIFKPSGMKNTFILGSVVPISESIVSKHAYQYWYHTTVSSVDSIPRFKYTHYNCSGTVGDQNVITTIPDLLLFDKALFAGKLLRKATMDLAFTPVGLNDGTTFQEGSMDVLHGKGKGSYGLGWSIYEQDGIGKGVGHSGFNRGLLTFYYHNLEKGYSFAAFDNTASPHFRDIMTFIQRANAGLNPKIFFRKQSLARTYGNILVREGVQQGSVFFALHRSDSGYYVSERELNWLGYDLLFNAFDELALEVLKINTLLFPGSFNVYDTYGEALARNGFKKEAILMYENSLSINPDNTLGLKALLKLKESLIGN